jgi:AGCS family alanine or glycine:cation symporter
MDAIVATINTLNDIIWHDYALFALLGVGILFTVWSGFGQYRALTHGVSVVRGKYDDRNDPGAINHFQALSTALSATVGLGNIAGVAIAISMGGPGALFWMWVVGVVGMALKMTEVTQSMLFRDTSNPDDPHGGPMWVCRRGFAQMNPKLAGLGTVVGGIFCITLLVSAFTGGNMFQAWNVADVSFTNFGIPRWVAGFFLASAVGAVIVGGIHRIGEVAARIVPVMCAVYVLAGLIVIVANIADVPETLRMIFREAFSPSEGVGAFIGGTAGYGFLIGMQRALFSSESGQGSAPIAHSAAKTDEPVREGVVAGLEPFIDTLCVCTLTGLVILLSGVWDRAPMLAYESAPRVTVAPSQSAELEAAGLVEWNIQDVRVAPVDGTREGDMQAGRVLYAVADAGLNSATGLSLHRVNGVLSGSAATGWTASFAPFTAAAGVTPELAVEGVFFELAGASLTAEAFDSVIQGLGFWIVPLAAWLFAFSTIISWSYYGEQGIVYLFGEGLVMTYRIIYCLLIMVTVLMIHTQDQLATFMNLGTGLMLWANIPIMLIFGSLAMRAYRNYFKRYRSGMMEPAHAAPKMSDVVSGDDVE